MTRITLRIPDELNQEIEERVPDGKKSEWFREAAREKLDRPDLSDQVDDLDDRVAQIESLPILNRLLQ